MKNETQKDQKTQVDASSFEMSLNIFLRPTRWLGGFLLGQSAKMEISQVKTQADRIRRNGEIEANKKRKEGDDYYESKKEEGDGYLKRRKKEEDEYYERRVQEGNEYFKRSKEMRDAEEKRLEEVAGQVKEAEKRESTLNESNRKKEERNQLLDSNSSYATIVREMMMESARATTVINSEHRRQERDEMRKDRLEEHQRTLELLRLSHQNGQDAIVAIQKEQERNGNAMKELLAQQLSRPALPTSSTTNLSLSLFSGNELVRSTSDRHNNSDRRSLSFHTLPYNREKTSSPYLLEEGGSGAVVSEVHTP